MIDLLPPAETLQLEPEDEDDQSPLIFKGIIAGLCLSAPLWVLIYYGCRAILKAMGVV